MRLAAKVAVTGRGGYFQDTLGRQNEQISLTRQIQVAVKGTEEARPRASLAFWLQQLEQGGWFQFFQD